MTFFQKLKKSYYIYKTHGRNLLVKFQDDWEKILFTNPQKESKNLIRNCRLISFTSAYMKVLKRPFIFLYRESNSFYTESISFYSGDSCIVRLPPITRGNFLKTFDSNSLTDIKEAFLNFQKLQTRFHMEFYFPDWNVMG